jgi:hypothetical protein
LSRPDVERDVLKSGDSPVTVADFGKFDERSLGQPAGKGLVNSVRMEAAVRKGSRMIMRVHAAVPTQFFFL